MKQYDHINPMHDYSYIIISILEHLQQINITLKVSKKRLISQ